MEQAKMMNQQQQMMSMNQHQPPPQPPPPQVMKPPIFKQPPLSSSSSSQNVPMTMINRHAYTSNYLKTPQSNQQMMMMNQPPPPLMNRSYGLWPPPLPPSSSASIDPMKFQNPNPNLKAPLGGGGGGYLSGGKQQQHLGGSKHLGPRSNWKGKKYNDKRKDSRRNENLDKSLIAGSSNGGLVAGGGYKPPTLNELQHQNRVKARRFFTKKKFNPYHHNNNGNGNGNNRGNYAPRNTSSFIIRAKKSGGIAELVSPCPVTPAVLPTPMFSPSKEVLGDMAKEEWGVDGYGSMKGLIRLRSSPGREDDGDEEEDEGGSSESDVEEHVEVERRLDHDLSRFEMIYPNYAGGMEYNNVLENRVDDQDTHIAQLEEENLILKERLFLMEREFGDLRRRLQSLERQGHGGGDEINEEVSENDTGSGGEAHSVGDNNEFMEENTVHQDVLEKEETKNEEFDKGHRDVKEKEETDDEGFVEEDTGHGDVKGTEETTSVDQVAEAAKNVDENDERKNKNDDETIEVKDENMGQDVPVKDENNEKDGSVDEVSAGELKETAVGDTAMEEVGQEDNQGKD